MERKLKMHKRGDGRSLRAICNKKKFIGVFNLEENWRKVTCGNCLRLRKTPESWLRKLLWWIFG